MLDGNAAPPSFTLKSIEKFAKHFNLTFQEFIGIPPPSKGKWEYLAKDLDTVLAHAGREVTDAEIKMIEAGIQQALRNVLEQKQG
jgi:hypothetical protein